MQCEGAAQKIGAVTFNLHLQVLQKCTCRSQLRHKSAVCQLGGLHVRPHPLDLCGLCCGRLLQPICRGHRTVRADSCAA